MNYVPLIKSAKPRKQFRIGKHGVLLGDIESFGEVKYAYVLVVYDEREKPCFFVASEINDMAEQFGGGSHFLGIFNGDGHANLGTDDRWGIEEEFTVKALEIALENFGEAKG